MNLRDFIRRSVRRLVRRWRWLRGSISRSDTARWQQNVHEVPVWDERNRILAGLIPRGSSVLDLGAGAQTLRTHLIDCEYQPCDFVPNEGVLRCDFNRGIYPATTKVYDYFVCSGVLEYIRDLNTFLQKVSALGHQGLVTYADLRPHHSRLSRLRHGWVNHLSRTELESLLRDVGLEYEYQTSWQEQLIYRIRRPPAGGSS